MPDEVGSLEESAVQATYDAMQQLLPGESQDATKLEMGRTYEEVDQGVVVPRARGAAPTERELAMASGVAQGVASGVVQGVPPSSGKRQAIGRLLGRFLRNK